VSKRCVSQVEAAQVYLNIARAVSCLRNFNHSNMQAWGNVGQVRTVGTTMSSAASYFVLTSIQSTKSSFGPSKAQCPCAGEIDKVRAQIGNATEIPFDATIVASEQAIELWIKVRDCQTSSSDAHESLIQVYKKLIEQFEGAISTYAIQSPPSPSKDAFATTNRLSTVDGWRDESSIRRHGQGDPTSRGSGLQTPGVTCIPSKMFLGSYELDDQQCRQLAVELIYKKLIEMGVILNQARYWHITEATEVHFEADASFKRILRLLGSIDSAKPDR
jgi:hypothetical protein